MSQNSIAPICQRQRRFNHFRWALPVAVRSPQRAPGPGDAMTSTAADGAKPDIPPQSHHPDKAGPPGEAETSGTGTSSGPAGEPVYVGHWILRSLLGTAVRAAYEERAGVFNRDLAAYFDTTEHISEDDRRQIRGRLLPALELMNAYQAWDAVFDRFIGAVVSLVVFPLWLACAAAASAVVWASPLPAVKVAYLCLLLVFLVRVFAAYLSIEDAQFLLKRGRVLGLFTVLVSGGLLFWPSPKLGPLEQGGALLLTIAGTVIAAAVALFLLIMVESSTGSVRMAATAVYLAGIGALAFGATSREPGWPSWLAHGISSALWASLGLVVVVGVLCLLSFLPLVGLWHWKNRRHVVAELVQTLTWLGLRLEDGERPEHERSELSRALPGLSLFEDLEYVAGLIQHYLPRKLRTLDPAGDAIVAERCRGMAAAVRQLKLDLVLNQNASYSEIAGRIVPAIVPICCGEWEKIAYIAPQERLAPVRWKRAARGLGKVIVAVTPLAVLLVLQNQRNRFGWATQLVPIAATWLLVAILTWIDPRTESSISGVKTMTDLMRGSRSGS